MKEPVVSQLLEAKQTPDKDWFVAGTGTVWQLTILVLFITIFRICVSFNLDHVGNILATKDFR